MLTTVNKLPRTATLRLNRKLMLCTGPSRKCMSARVKKWWFVLVRPLYSQDPASCVFLMSILKVAVRKQLFYRKKVT